MPAMTRRRDMRVLALQTLYQLDARGGEDVDQVRQSLEDAPANDETKVDALDLAMTAWAGRDEADRIATHLAPDWPTHRQPPVDRSILRLAYCEISGGRAPAAVAINEAIELAKSFGSERSPAFINGVLDKMARQLERAAHHSGSATSPPAPAPVDAEPGQS